MLPQEKPGGFPIAPWTPSVTKRIEKNGLSDRTLDAFGYQTKRKQMGFPIAPWTPSVYQTDRKQTNFPIALDLRLYQQTGDTEEKLGGIVGNHDGPVDSTAGGKEQAAADH